MKDKLYRAFEWLLVSNLTTHLLCVCVMSLLLGYIAGMNNDGYIADGTAFTYNKVIAWNNDVR